MIANNLSAKTAAIDLLPTSIKYIANALKKVGKPSPADVVRIIQDAKVQLKDLEEWADFDHPDRDSYGRKLVFKYRNFEIMVMSWRPGDFSAIHDHGHTQWGAVQIFGPAEHATFREESGKLTTLSRSLVEPGKIIGVGHSLIHQMGNPTSDSFFLSLHVYGDGELQESITGDARVFDLQNNTIQRVDGGVFYALPSRDIKKLEPGPKADFPTGLRHMVELIRRLQKIGKHEAIQGDKKVQEVVAEAFAAENRTALLRSLAKISDEHGHVQNSVYWRILNQELREAARLQNDLFGEQRMTDRFHKYAELYDSLICRPCLDGFMRRYLFFFAEKYRFGFPDHSIISLGCGTGLVEEFMVSELGANYKKLYGIDISASMVKEAKKRIRADVGDVLSLDPSIRLWDLAFSGLNVFHYLDHSRLEEAIKKTAAIVRPGGYFIGDFITPDHIRWYPNVMFSADKKVISLRTPCLIEENGHVFQESEIININYAEDQMEVSYAGKHKRFLPPLNRVRSYFEKAFGGKVDLYDAHTLAPIPKWADSCKSTRYVVIAEKGLDPKLKQ